MIIIEPKIIVENYNPIQKIRNNKRLIIVL